MMNMLRPVVAVLTVCAAVCGCAVTPTPNDDMGVPKDFEMPGIVLRAAQTLTVESGAKISGGGIAGEQVIVSGAPVSD